MRFALGSRSMARDLPKVREFVACGDKRSESMADAGEGEGKKEGGRRWPFGTAGKAAAGLTAAAAAAYANRTFPINKLHTNAYFMSLPAHIDAASHDDARIERYD